MTSNVGPLGSCGLVIGSTSVAIAAHLRCHGSPLYMESGKEDKAARWTLICQREPSGQYRCPSQKNRLRIFAQSPKDDRLRRKTSVDGVKIPCRQAALAVRAQGQGWPEQKTGWRTQRPRGPACWTCPGSAAVASRRRRGWGVCRGPGVGVGFAAFSSTLHNPKVGVLPRVPSPVAVCRHR